MQLTLWTYEGPPHVGAMRIATSMRHVHYVLHAPQGDTYADLLFTMIERQDKRPPVTYTTFQARDLGGDTANIVTRAVQDAVDRFAPKALLVGESCTAELIQDNPGSLAMGMNLGLPIIPLELPSYSKKENWGAAETFYQLVRTLLLERSKAREPRPGRDGRRPRVNLLGGTILGFRCRDDIAEVTKLLASLGVDVHVSAPLGAEPDDLRRLPDADANVCLYPEIALTTCSWLQRTFDMPTISTVPIGVGATRDFIAEVGRVLAIDVSGVLGGETLGAASLGSSQSRMPWYSRSVDATYLTGKRVFIFGDGTHVVAAARIASEELGFKVVGLGTYSREMARDVKACAEKYGVTALITDDYLDVERTVAELQVELVLGTQMERHIAKRLGVPCSVISTPIHVQDVPARYSPQMGFEGANVIFDAWVHPLMMGLEEHLLQMFREDFEFGDGASPSHLHSVAPAKPEGPASAMVSESHGPAITPVVSEPAPVSVQSPTATTVAEASGAQHETPSVAPTWSVDGEKELSKIPFFVRGKARRNTEKYAAAQGIDVITTETLYEAKAHYGR
ncbi:MAG: ferredoxin:protochlorophyllide reductase (ATP-dependent) subunit B [Gemmatimonadaceae bacterium]|nr:ferredoxin:protochlorophyllide reductase (ATP-dependent) subunit B [Gemmatimonadaceae bacterium]